ncbi:hypothetical protein DXG03_001987 [Asterophora parasitica]|uniref:PEBP-like protein n=1 Tax=Asterophora parasitica TaxID=117018 RepID=A0A9P7GBP3_9AGAR|nr:hypothetical protein DXG03_001987 [Asterophora parasitica]
MLALRKLRVPHSTVLLRRGNATLQSATDTVPNVPPPVPAPVKAKAAPAPTPGAEPEHTTSGRRRFKRPVPPTRPAISTSAPRKWNRPLAEGVLPAYDLALKLLKTDSIRLQTEADGVRKEIKDLEGKVTELGGYDSEGAREAEERLEEKREKLHILQVQSKVNLPEVRWRVANAMADMEKPAHRHLVEQRWRKEGDLDLLMERLHQMKVIPDVLPDLRPSIDTLEPPSLYANVFHTDTRLYTLLLVDPDVPDEDNASFRTFLHWLKPNVPLSATTTSRIPDLNSHTPYIPPHPQRGTPYHRYVLLLLPQPALGSPAYTRNLEARAQPGVPTSVHLDIPVIGEAERKDFDTRAFCERWGLNGKAGGGAHMWREVWDEKVSAIYKNLLSKSFFLPYRRRCF